MIPEIINQRADANEYLERKSGDLLTAADWNLMQKLIHQHINQACLGLERLALYTRDLQRASENANKKLENDIQDSIAPITAKTIELDKRLTDLNLELSSFKNSLVPAGTIVMWSGEISNIPQRWALCDGSNNTPDLRNRFIMGAGPDASSRPNTSGEPDQHKHRIGAFQVGSKTSTNGQHNHKIPSAWYARGLDDGDYAGIDTRNDMSQNTVVQDSGAHAHDVTVSINAFDTQEAYATLNRPRWYALCFIMKL